MSKSSFDVRIAEETTKQVGELSKAIMHIASKFSGRENHPNVQAKALDVLENVNRLIDTLITSSKK